MPEIAEVALTAEVLEKYFLNQILVSFDFINGRYSRNNPDGYTQFVDALPLKVTGINSRGKFLWFELIDPKNQEKKWYIWNTFGLTGMWSIEQQDYVKAIMSFKKGMAYFSDMRNFGTFKFSTDSELLGKKLNELSPDFLKDDDFNLEKIKKYKTPIVKILMDQKKVGSGLGNYLVAEILYRAGISPHRPGNHMSDADIENLEYWIKYIVKLSYVDNHIGYMMNLEKESDKIKKRNYHPDIKLKEKSFQFMVYRRKEDPYGNKVKADKIIGSGTTKRTTYWVPAVQK